MDNRLDMAGSLKEITQRLVALDQQIEALGDTFTETYRSYLKQLAQTVRQQLILSCYQICTENYPKRFLALSMSQRQKLQDDLKTLAEQTEADLNALLQPISQTQAHPDPVELPDELETLLSNEDLDSDLQAEEPEPATPLSPIKALTLWQEQLERSILKTLKSASHAANQQLQDAEILSKRIPQAVLEAAAKTDGTDPSAPNLLNLLVSASEKSDPTEASPTAALSALMQVVAVNLRLNEIEFNDIPLMTLRNKIRELRKQFQALARDYQKKQREQSVIEAQHAWKSTWT